MMYRWGLLGAGLTLGALALTGPVTAQSGAIRTAPGRPVVQPVARLRAQPAPPGTAQPPAPAGAQPGLQPDAVPGAPNADMAIQEELNAPRPVISLLLLSDPTISVAYHGDFGPMRIIGTLVDAPETPIRVTLPTGGTRLVPWTELYSLTIQRIPQADVPLGAFTVTLSSEEGALPRSTAVLDVSYGGGENVGALPPPPAVASALPPGALTLIGEPYNALRVPTERITDIRMVPVRGTLASMPHALIGVEVRASSAPGARNGGGRGKGAGPEGEPADAGDVKIVEVPLEEVELYRRDPARQLVSLTLADGQIFTGRLVFLPNVAIGVEETTLSLTEPLRVQNYPLARIAQFERSVPRAGAGGP